MSSTVSFLTVAPLSCAHDPGDAAPGSYTPRTGGRSGVEGLEALAEAAGVALLGAGERLEPLGDLLEALVAGRLGETRVHLGVLVGLALDGRVEVVGGGTDGDARHRVADLGEEVEVAERVTGLTLRHRAEQRGHVGVALDVGLLGEVEVAPVGLALTREGVLEVRVGLGAVQVGHALFSLVCIGLRWTGLSLIWRGRPLR